jgi:hypothetical protein
MSTGTCKERAKLRSKKKSGRKTGPWDDHHGHETDQEAPPENYQPVSEQNHRIEVNHSTSPHCKRLYSTIKERMAHLKINQADTFPSTFYSMETASSVT